MGQEHAEQCLKRLMSIDWKYRQETNESAIVLMREYFRRAALWAQALDLEESSPFTNFACHLLPEYPAPKALIEQFNEQMKQKPSGYYLARGTCVMMLHWAAIQDHPKVVAFGLPHPYEPLLRMYERGVVLNTHHGDYTVGWAMFPRSSSYWRHFISLPPLLDLDDITLDLIDSCEEMSRNKRHRSLPAEAWKRTRMRLRRIFSTLWNAIRRIVRR